jgi:hypothetical protein
MGCFQCHGSLSDHCGLAWCCRKSEVRKLMQWSTATTCDISSQVFILEQETLTTGSTNTFQDGQPCTGTAGDRIARNSISSNPRALTAYKPPSLLAILQPQHFRIFPLSTPYKKSSVKSTNQQLASPAAFLLDLWRQR